MPGNEERIKRKSVNMCHVSRVRQRANTVEHERESDRGDKTLRMNVRETVM